MPCLGTLSIQERHSDECSTFRLHNVHLQESKPRQYPVASQIRGTYYVVSPGEGTSILPAWGGRV